MSSLFSIGEDELDLDDEDFLLEACEIAVGSINNEALSKEAQQVPCGKNTTSHENPRKPFTSLGNVEARDRAVGKHKTITTVNMDPTNTAKYSGSNTCVPNSTTPTSSVSLFCSSKNTGTSSFPPSKRLALDGHGTDVFMSRSGCPATTFSRNSSSSVLSFNGASSVSQTGRGRGNVSCRDNPVSSRKPLNVQSFGIGPGNQSLGECGTSQANVNAQGNATAVCLQKSYQSRSPSVSHREKNSPNVKNTPTTQPTNSSNTSYCSSKNSERFSRFKNHSNTIRNSPSPVYPARSIQQRSGCSSVDNNNREARQQSVSNAGTPRRRGSDFHHQSPNTSNSFEKRGISKASPHSSSGTPHREVSRPHTTPLSARTPRTRKFPGPAGLLPKLVQGQNLDNVTPVSSCPMPRSLAVQNKISLSNPSEDEDFKRDPWTSMYQDFLQNVPLLMRYSVTRVYTEAVQQRLDRGKVPCMCALVKAVSLTDADASVLLKDPTGEIHGTVHHKVLEEYQSELGPGAGLVLKQVSVFSPSPRKHYLNITPGNILQIYPPDPYYISSSQSTASQASQVKGAVIEQRTRAPVKSVACESRIIKDDQQCGESKADSRASEDAVTSLEQEVIEDLLQGLEDDDLFDEALLA